MTAESDSVPLQHRRLEQIAMTALRVSRLLTECGARVRVAHDGAALIVRGLGVELVGSRTGYASQEITVSSGGALVGEGLVNNYGEFVVDKLEPGKDYEVKIEAAGYKAVAKTVTLAESLNLGLVLLEKA